MRTPRLVASDVDGTLLDPLERVSPRTSAVLARMRAATVPFALVSGRPPRWIPTVATAAGTRGHAVCSNGAVLYDIAADRVLSAHRLDPMLLHDVVHALTEAIPDCRVAVERVGERAHGLDGYEFATEPGYRHPWPDSQTVLAPRAELLGLPAVKLLVGELGSTSDELAAAATAVLGDAVHITFSSSLGMIEIAPPGITKGTGLAELAELHGVDAPDVVAFGDMPNDVPMLRWAGLGVAMANAHPEVLAVADEVTGPNSEDGVAQVLERWF